MQNGLSFWCLDISPVLTNPMWGRLLACGGLSARQSPPCGGLGPTRLVREMIPLEQSSTHAAGLSPVRMDRPNGLSHIKRAGASAYPTLKTPMLCFQ